MKLKTPAGPGAASHAETRRQLLEAAGAVFAGAGFRDATVREICRRAGANVAAVNYHFGDKETLYLEVLRYAHGKALEKYPPLLNVSADAPPEKKLRAFVHSLLLRIFDKGPTAWHGKIMLREMIEPSAALDSLVEERMRPMAGQLWQIVADILDRPPNDERVRLWRTLLPAAAPRAERLDVSKLTESYPDMCGGHIRNVVLRAAFNLHAPEKSRSA